MDQLRNLWHFVRVAKAGSFTAAAAGLELSVAALSKSIARLEQKLEVQLFVRSSRSLLLTDEGRALLDKVGGPLDVIEGSYRRVQRISTEAAGVVRLSAVTAYGKHCVLPLLPRFFARFPKIDLVMSFHDGGRGLTRQVFDIRINWGEEREQEKVSQTLCQMPLILVASPDYLARRGTPTKPEELQSHDCINVALANGGRAHWTFELRNARRERHQIAVTPRGRLVVMDELDAVTDAAEAGLGITVSSAENVLSALREGRLQRLLEDYTIVGQGQLHSQIIMQYPRRNLLSAKVRALVDFLLAELKSRDPLDLVEQTMRNAVRKAKS